MSKIRCYHEPDEFYVGYHTAKIYAYLPVLKQVLKWIVENCNDYNIEDRNELNQKLGSLDVSRGINMLTVGSFTIHIRNDDLMKLKLTW